jgi:hypothetical protein
VKNTPVSLVLTLFSATNLRNTAMSSAAASTLPLTIEAMVASCAPL